MVVQQNGDAEFGGDTARTNLYEDSLATAAFNNPQSKVCIKNYNVKALYTARMQPFFGQSSDDKLAQLKEIRKYNFTPNHRELDELRKSRDAAAQGLPTKYSPAK